MMTKNENERLAVVESKIEGMEVRLEKMDCKLDKYFETMPALIERVNNHEGDLKAVKKDHKKIWDRLNSNTRVAIYAIIGSVGAIVIFILKGAI